MPSFIEVQFPVSKVSKESYKERKAGAGQTLTGLGKWWGRKPLILVRATILGLLLPATDNPKKDREIFLKILTMDEEGLWLRKSKSIPLKVLYSLANSQQKQEYFSPDSTEEKPKYKSGLKAEKKTELQKLIFNQLSYDEKLNYTDRPEQIDNIPTETWQEINEYLATNATNLSELIQQLGVKKFGHIPKVGDAFCGGGSVPFEAARIGCEAYGSDLNPVATLLTWAALNIVGGGEEVAKTVREAQEKVYNEVDKIITEWGIEHNSEGWRADAYLYCNETRCPECGWLVPLAPSWVIGEKTKTIAQLIPAPQPPSLGESKEKVLTIGDSGSSQLPQSSNGMSLQKGENIPGYFDIIIKSGVSKEELKEAKNGTVKNSALHCPHCQMSTPIVMIRGDRKTENGTEYGLRLWENDDLIPRPDDVFQERLYCIRWVETYIDDKGKEQTKRYYLAPDKEDLEREKEVLQLLTERFKIWQQKGYLPSRKIESGYNTDQPIRERGWTHWHHLFNPRQLLTHGLLLATADKFDVKGDRLSKKSGDAEKSALSEIDSLNQENLKSDFGRGDRLSKKSGDVEKLELSEIDSLNQESLKSDFGDKAEDAVEKSELSEIDSLNQEGLKSSDFWDDEKEKAIAFNTSWQKLLNSSILLIKNCYSIWDKITE